MKKSVKRTLIAVSVMCLIAVSLTFALASCSRDTWENKMGFDLSLPNLEGIDAEGGDANAAGWYATMIEDFKYGSLEELEAGGRWTASPHDRRWESDHNKNKTDDKKDPKYNYEDNWWCPDMISFDKDAGLVKIKSEQRSNHVCSKGICNSTGRFTSGIETRRLRENSSHKGDGDELLFAQAFGYFETRVKFPKGDGLWSAFWLQSSNQRKLGNEGLDGTEIDVYESAFIKNPTKMGHALLWNGYVAEKGAKVDGYILDTDTDLYDGFHTFALKWTPEYYVFYIDGKATWASNGGGVSKVKEFLRLTVEIDAGDTYGPHGQKIGKFTKADEFVIDYVKVYQNKNYEQYIIDDDKFPGALEMGN